MAKIVGYILFALVSFVISLYLTFPWDAARELVQKEVSKAVGATVAAEKLEPSWLTGIHAEAIEIELPDSEEPLKLDALDARISVLSLLSGAKGGTARVPMAQGVIEAEAEVTDARAEVEADIVDIELALIPALKAATGLALAGEVDADAQLDIGIADVGTTAGNIHLTGTGLEVLEGSQAGGFPIPALVLGSLDWTIPIEGGKAKITNQTLSGPTVEASVNGEIVLAKPFGRSLMNLKLRFKPTPEFLRKEPLLGSLLNNLSRYRSPDGFYGYQVTGTVKRPRFTPTRG